MLNEPHNLVAELPEYKEDIHNLKISNKHFARLMEQYNDLDKQILQIEKSGENVSDFHLEDLKKKRLALKDELFGMIEEHRKAG
ncbi:MAG: DUF465 domain-containing protein [Hyphomicrobiales bacterium]|nr:DUF465 domain-containing protein [Hyphomicrobiales bacterium]